MAAHLTQMTGWCIRNSSAELDWLSSCMSSYKVYRTPCWSCFFIFEVENMGRKQSGRNKNLTTLSFKKSRKKWRPSWHFYGHSLLNETECSNRLNELCCTTTISGWIIMIPAKLVVFFMSDKIWLPSKKPKFLFNCKISFVRPAAWSVMALILFAKWAIRDIENISVDYIRGPRAGCKWMWT